MAQPDGHETPLAVVREQAEDGGVWFVAATAPEAYLQQELRRLHAAVEAAGLGTAIERVIEVVTEAMRDRGIRPEGRMEILTEIEEALRA